MAREILGAAGLWGNSKSLVKGNSRATRPRGVPKPAGDLGNRTTGKVAGPGRWSSGAKDAEKSAGRLRETGRGRCISYMQRPRPIVPDGPESRAPTRRRGHFQPTALGQPGSAAVVQFEGADIAGRAPRLSQAGPHGRDWPRWSTPGHDEVPFRLRAVTARRSCGGPGVETSPSAAAHLNAAVQALAPTGRRHYVSLRATAGRHKSSCWNVQFLLERAMTLSGAVTPS